MGGFAGNSQFQRPVLPLARRFVERAIDLQGEPEITIDKSGADTGCMGQLEGFIVKDQASSAANQFYSLAN